MKVLVRNVVASAQGIDGLIGMDAVKQTEIFPV